jgi:purine-binding chemotaxis protein CheW
VIGLEKIHGRDSEDGRQYLTFDLGGQEYGVGILTVQEIRGWSAVTAIPHSPKWLLGVINLRGVVVPIVDLRIRFNLDRVDFNESTVVIILNLVDRVVGVVVDAVSDVITLNSAQIKPTPGLGNTDTSHIIGFGTLDERMRILLDVDRLIAGSDLAAAKSVQ